MTGLFVIGIIASILVTVAYIPEAVKAIRTRETRDLSSYWLIIANVGSAFYLVYGFMLHSIPIIISSAASVLLISILIVCKIEFH
ncbi:MAG: hypothetical protein KGI06_05400 [Candidatus Micrarchaeota archaeon]|nr:hypothetical protein [Candidatus Micrarchaeota archaeon]